MAVVSKHLRSRVRFTYPGDLSPANFGDIRPDIQTQAHRLFSLGMALQNLQTAHVTGTYVIRESEIVEDD